MSKYRTKLRETSARRQEETHITSTAGQLGSKRCLPIGLPSAVGKFGLSTVAPRGAAQEVEMEHAWKMTLVDPRLLDTIRSPPPPPPPPTDTIGKKVQALDDEMMSILDRKDIDDRTKVTL